MSQAELQRFATALQGTPVLAEAYRSAATPLDLAAQLRADGYAVTDAEVEEVHRNGTELSDEQLDTVSGGVVAAALASIVGIGAIGVLAGAIIGIVADSAKRGLLPKG